MASKQHSLQAPPASEVRAEALLVGIWGHAKAEIDKGLAQLAEGCLRQVCLDADLPEQHLRLELLHHCLVFAQYPAIMQQTSQASPHQATDFAWACPFTRNRWDEPLLRCRCMYTLRMSCQRLSNPGVSCRGGEVQARGHCGAGRPT